MEIPAKFFAEVVELTVAKRTVSDSIDVDFINLEIVNDSIMRECRILTSTPYKIV